MRDGASKIGLAIPTSMPNTLRGWKMCSTFRFPLLTPLPSYLPRKQLESSESGCSFTHLKHEIKHIRA